MEALKLIGIFLGICSGLAGILGWINSLQGNSTWSKKTLLTVGLVFLVSVVLTAGTYYYQQPESKAEVKQNKGLYIANGSDNNKIYFHNDADPATRRAAFINSKTEVLVRNIRNGFGYVEFMNTQGKASYGWLEMRQLIVKP